MRVFDYIIVCKSPDFKNVDRMSQLMLFVSIISFIYSIMKGIYHHPALLIAISASVVSWWIFCVYQRKRGILPYYRLGLLFASWGWYLQPNGLIIAGVFLIAALFERQVKFPSEIAFDEAGVVMNSFPKKYIPWKELQNVLIKDNVLTIDFKNNKLIQKDINEPVTATLEAEFNGFCSEQLSK